MTSESISRQDASARMPLAVCHNGRVIALLVGFNGMDEQMAGDLRAAASAEIGVPAEQLEILAVCHLHPTSSAVDCLDCEPAHSPITEEIP